MAVRIPKISVTIPVGGAAAKYVDEAIYSLFDQTETRWEAIVHPGDASATEHIPSGAYSDDRVRVLSPSNECLASSRNRCLEASSAEYVAVLDSDDVSSEDRLGWQAAYLDENPDVDLIGQSTPTVRLIDGSGDTVREHGAEPPLTLTKPWDGCVIHHSSVMFRNSGVRYREKFVNGDDHDLYMRLGNGDLSNLVAHEKDLVTVRHVEGSVSRPDPSRSQEMCMVAAAFREQRRRTGEDGYEEWDPQRDNEEIIEAYIDRLKKSPAP